MTAFLSLSLMEVRDGNVLVICELSLVFLEVVLVLSSLGRVVVMAETWEELD